MLLSGANILYVQCFNFLWWNGENMFQGFCIFKETETKNFDKISNSIVFYVAVYHILGNEINKLKY